VKPGIGLVTINLSGGFSCALTVSTQKTNIIMQIFSDCRNLSLLGNAAHRPVDENSLLLWPAGQLEMAAAGLLLDEQLTGFLQRIADEQGLTPGVHPGFSRLGRRQKRPC